MSKEHKLRMARLYQKGHRFVYQKFMKLWQTNLQNKRLLGEKYEVLKENHKEFTKKQCFEAFRKKYRQNRMHKRLYFKKWVMKCKLQKRKDNINQRIDSLNIIKARQLKQKIFNYLKYNTLTKKVTKYHREQENLRRCLKADLEEKSI